jgi:hypothetical protein
MFATVSAIASFGNGFAAADAVRAAAGRLPLPLPLHHLPYPGRGPVGLALSTETI